ncbi:TetR/AcrR family transcriptional regulator [Rothia uropygioeca]|uniref:TetR/AcrR family transcriptional regulator n=1 Tax=Kocuria sp. 257 TaxID=2021970 RepID=UPI00192D4419|nr:TetR/AcrR family transcriptional regulator [Kocuria sp. 257]
MSARARRRGSELEHAVFEATLAELAEHGMAGLTFDRIAARAGAGKASLYRRWTSPEQLVMAALTRAEDQARRSEHPSGTRLDAVGNLRSELITFLGDLATGLTTPLGRALTPLLLERDRRPELWNQITVLLVNPRQRLVSEALTRAAADGQIDASAVTPARISAGPAIVLASHLTTGPVTSAEVTDIVDEVILPALGWISR